MNFISVDARQMTRNCIASLFMTPFPFPELTY